MSLESALEQSHNLVQIVYTGMQHWLLSDVSHVGSLPELFDEVEIRLDIRLAVHSVLLYDFTLEGLTPVVEKGSRHLFCLRFYHC